MTERVTTRVAEIQRETNETQISVRVGLDGAGQYDIATGVGFFDHMLEQLARHSLIDLKLRATGDLQIDAHHTVEDCGIVLGQAVAKALGDRRGIRRYGAAELPMDEALTRVAIDLSGRPYLVWRVEFPAARIGDTDTELFREWFQAFSQNAAITMHVENFYGANAHHVAESCFKALARAFREAIEIDPRAADEVPSTKGQLGG